MTMRHCLPLLLLPALANCAHEAVLPTAPTPPPRAECQLHGGVVWHELSSPHFVMHTDVPVDQARVALETLETIRTVINDFFAGNAESATRATVIFFASTAELNELYDRNGFMDADDRLLVITPETLSSDNWRVGSTLVHELAHEIAAYVLLRAPRWLFEGLAEFHATTHVEADGKHVSMGIADSTDLWYVRQERFSIAQLFTMRRRLYDDQSEKERRFYASSWIAVHFLVNRHFSEFSQWLDRLHRGEDPELSFNRVFGDSARLEKEIDDYLNAGRYSSFHYDLPKLDLKITVQELAPAVVHYDRYRVIWHAIQDGVDRPLKTARADATQAIQLGTTVFDARHLRLVLTDGNDRREEEVRRLVKDFPNEPDAHYAFSLYLPNKGATREQHLAELRRTLELNPHHVDALNALAWDMVVHGEGLKALPLAEMAVGGRPWDANLVDTLATAQATARMCNQAESTEQRAIDLLDWDKKKELKEFTARAEAFSHLDCFSRVPTAPPDESPVAGR